MQRLKGISVASSPLFCAPQSCRKVPSQESQQICSARQSHCRRTSNLGEMTLYDRPTQQRNRMVPRATLSHLVKQPTKETHLSHLQRECRGRKARRQLWTLIPFRTLAAPPDTAP